MTFDTARTRAELLELMSLSEERPRFTFFWGHTPKDPNQTDASCFSQWFPSRFQVDENVYPTAEHFMMAEKARLFGDHEILQQILESFHPGDAKKLGRKVAGFEAEQWDKHRFELVVQGNVSKFSQDAGLGNFLLQTGNRVLVEASPRDRIWGIGMGRNNPNAEDPSQWRGSNLLGFALMEVRQQIQDAG